MMKREVEKTRNTLNKLYLKELLINYSSLSYIMYVEISNICKCRICSYNELSNFYTKICNNSQRRPLSSMQNQINLRIWYLVLIGEAIKIIKINELYPEKSKIGRMHTI
jgi:hypothetical protein